MDVIQKIMMRVNEKTKASRMTISNLGIEKLSKKIKQAKTEGTTTLALKFKDGVIMAADRRCVSGETIFSDEMIKIEEIGSLSCFAGAGWVSDFQLLTEILRDDFIPELEKYWDTEIFVDGQANLLKYLMRAILFFTWPILAGWDPYENKSRIFSFEPGGAFFEFDEFIASGSGENFALGVLEKEWSKDCSKGKGLEMAVEALLAASKKDRNTSDPRLHSLIIKIITPQGIAAFSSEKSFDIAWKKAIKEQARKGINDSIGAYFVRSFLEKSGKEAKKTKTEKEKKNDNPKPRAA
jgi:proteasome beta subunit